MTWSSILPFYDRMKFHINTSHCITIHLLLCRFGRLKTLFISLAFHIFVGFLSAFSPNYWVFLATRFITGFFKPGIGVVMFTLASEYVGGKYRPMSGMILWLAFAISLAVLGVKAYFIRKWKILFIACTIPYAFVLGFYR